MRDDFVYRFPLPVRDERTCFQVGVRSAVDLDYWKEEYRRTRHLISFDRYVPENLAGYCSSEYDIYQIFPPEQQHHFIGRGMTPITL